VSSAQYRLLAADGGEIEAGGGEVTVAAGILELQPATGAGLRLPPDRIAAVTEPKPYAVLITFADGTGLELSRLGPMRTQLLAELRDARAAVGASEAGAVGEAVRFTGTVGAGDADLHVFEDALLVMAGGVMVGGQPHRIAFAFVTDAQARDHTVTVTIAGRDPVVISRLGRRTDEFATLLGERLRAARSRTAAFLASLLPGLDPMAQRAAAALLRDGVAVPAAALNAIHPELFATLLRVAALPERFAAISALAGAGTGTDTASGVEVAIGFRQLTSVRRAAVGTTPWQDPSVTPHIGQHDRGGGRFGPGLGGVMAAGVMSGLGPGGGLAGYGPAGFGLGGLPGPGAGFGGYGGVGDYWAYRALGAGLGNSGGGRHQLTPRANVSYGLLIPETEDLAALTVAGDDPTILAFALLSPPAAGPATASASRGPVGYEVLNLQEPMTFVYRSAGRDPRAAVNRALDDIGFAPAQLHDSAGLTDAHRADAATSELTRSLLAAIPHDPAWPTSLTSLLTAHSR
jgi:hypothetical protein